MIKEAMEQKMVPLTPEIAVLLCVTEQINCKGCPNEGLNLNCSSIVESLRQIFNNNHYRR